MAEEFKEVHILDDDEVDATFEDGNRYKDEDDTDISE